METSKALDTARAEMTLISKSVVIKGGTLVERDFYIDGQVEGTINPKRKRLTIGPERARYGQRQRRCCPRAG